MATPQARPMKATVKESMVEVRTLPEAFELLERCLFQLVQSVAIVQQMYGLPTRNMASGSLRPIGPAGGSGAGNAAAKRTFSDAAKKRMSEGMRKFWAKRKAEALKRSQHAKKASLAALKAKKATGAKGKPKSTAKSKPSSGSSPAKTTSPAPATPTSTE